MNPERLSFSELAAFVCEHLKSRGVDTIVVGGSAITCWTPAIYTSEDIDFVAINGASRRTISAALHEIGFVANGRMYTHPACPYALDFVATTPQIDQRIITEFANIETQLGTIRVLKPEDAIADRVAAWVHWSDSESLNVAERCATDLGESLAQDAVIEALNAIAPGDPQATLRLHRARERLAVLLSTRSEKSAG